MFGVLASRTVGGDGWVEAAKAKFKLQIHWKLHLVDVISLGLGAQLTISKS